MQVVFQLWRHKQQPVVRLFGRRQFSSFDRHIVGQSFDALLCRCLKRQSTLRVSAFAQPQRNWLCIGIWIICVRRWFGTRLFLTHNPTARVVLNSVVDSVQVVAEPLVLHIDWRGSAVSSLMEKRLARNTFFLECLINSHAVFWHHVPVVKSMRHQHGRFDRIELVKVIATGPKIVVVAGNSIHILGIQLVADFSVATVSHLWIAAMNKIVQHVDIFAHVATRVTDQTVTTVVVVIRSIRRNRNDRL